MDACPATTWSDRTGGGAFGDMVFHVLFFLDFSLAENPHVFAPPAPFGLEEMDPSGVLPPRVYVANDRGRLRARLAVFAADPGAPARLVRHGNVELAAGERLLYDLRHVQHHVGQLQLMLRRAGVEPPRWVRRGGD